MNANRRKPQVKGFTLMELIIVIAIIGILVAILGPTMSTYYRKSRIKASNADARMVYNAAQTSAQTYISRDRGRADADKSGLQNTLIVSYNAASGTVSYGTAFGALVAADATNEGVAAQNVANAVARTVSDANEKNWAVCIQNYIVRGSISATSTGTNIVGYCSAAKTQASDRTNTAYSGWLTGTSDGTGVNCLQEVCDQYNNVLPTEPTTMPST